MAIKYPKIFSTLIMVLAIVGLLACMLVSSTQSHADSTGDGVNIGAVSTSDIYFMQSTANNKTGDYTVLDNAIKLKEGILKPEELPKIRIWFDKVQNKIWTLDHRRLIAFKLAGIKTVSVIWGTEDEIKQGSFKMTTQNSGDEIDLLFPNNKFYPIKRMEDNILSLEELKQLKNLYQG